MCSEIRAIILRDVKIYIDEMQKFARKDLHGMSAQKFKKLASLKYHEFRF